MLNSEWFKTLADQDGQLKQIEKITLILIKLIYLNY